MNKVRDFAAALVLVAGSASAMAADGISKDQAIEMATAAHPGQVEKAYQETKKGVEVWEVRIKGEDGNVWKVYYRVDNGELFMEKKA